MPPVLPCLPRYACIHAHSTPSYLSVATHARPSVTTGVVVVGQWVHIVASRDSATGVHSIGANATPDTARLYATARCGYSYNRVHPFRVGAGTGASVDRRSPLESYLHADVAAIGTPWA